MKRKYLKAKNKFLIEIEKLRSNSEGNSTKYSNIYRIILKRLVKNKISNFAKRQHFHKTEFSMRSPLKRIVKLKIKIALAIRAQKKKPKKQPRKRRKHTRLN